MDHHSKRLSSNDSLASLINLDDWIDSSFGIETRQNSFGLQAQSSIGGLFKLSSGESSSSNSYYGPETVPHVYYPGFDALHSPQASSSARVTRSRAKLNKNEQAAFNLLKLASVASSTTATTPTSQLVLRDDETENESDYSTSLSSFQFDVNYPYSRETTASTVTAPRLDHWHLSHYTQSPSQTQTSPRHSISSITSRTSQGTRVRQHRPARTQRAGSDADSIKSTGRSYSATTSTQTRSASASLSISNPSYPQRTSSENEEEEHAVAHASTSKKTRSTRTSTKRNRASEPAEPRKAHRSIPVPLVEERLLTGIEKAPGFARFYRTFPVSSAFAPGSFFNSLARASGEPSMHLMALPPGATWNKECDPLNLYTPRFIKNSGNDKAGACPICVESVARGGSNELVWLKLKNSSYVYHMSYVHGISNLSGLPYPPPSELRTISLGRRKAKDGRKFMLEGKCHCGHFQPLNSIKRVELNIPELLWWKHQKSCSKKKIDKIDETKCRDVFVNDGFLTMVLSHRKA